MEGDFLRHVAVSADEGVHGLVTVIEPQLGKQGVQGVGWRMHIESVFCLARLFGKYVKFVEIPERHHNKVGGE